MKRLSRAEEEQARDRSVPDLVALGLKVLLVGINPSLSSGAAGLHFATPGNRLWPALFGAGLTARLLDPSDTTELLASGIGITNLVNRATRTAREVGDLEFLDGAKVLKSTVEFYRPQNVAILGIGAYRRAFQQSRPRLGRQPNPFGPSQLWVLPNPSGLNAHYSLADLIELFRQVREAL